MTRVVFLDRDGTLNTERGFVARPADLVVLPGVPAALRRLRDAGWRAIVVTNQSGIARGLYGERDLAAVHARLHRELGEVPWAYFHCPHLPEATGPYGGPCACRKPQSGLLLQAAAILGVPLRGSVLIGDSARDLLMARELGQLAIHVHTGKPPAAERERMRAAGFTPHAEVQGLPAAVDWLLAHVHPSSSSRRT